ncbi:MAG: FUSC family protein [Mycobacteriaceae bacterium]|uniref:FUSC family protein n=1 Tax=Corynebacterium sp. TaxID=1720 RepID=UPI003F9B3CBC
MSGRIESPPPQAGWWRLLTAVNPSGPRWPGALRAALAVVLPASVALLAGQDTAMLMIAGGGLAVIFGEGLPFRTRWRVMATAGGFLAAGAVAGAFVGSVVWAQDGRWWLLLIALFTTAVAGMAGFVQNALPLAPPGTFFLVMVTGGSTMVAKQGLNPVEVGMWTAVGASCAVAIGMVPALFPSLRRRPETSAVERLEVQVASYTSGAERTVDAIHRVKGALTEGWNALADAGLVRGGEKVGPDAPVLVRRCLAAHRTLAGGGDVAAGTVPMLRPSIRYRLYRSLNWDSHAATTSVKIMVASLAAGVLGIALGLDRPDWAIVTVLVILQWGPDLRPGTIRGVHRLAGSVLGVLLFAGFHLLELEGFGLLAALAACQFLAEIFIVRNYAVAVVVITPLAMMMGGGMHQPLGSGVVSRIAEVGLATAFAMAALWFVLRDADERRAARQVDNCVTAMGALLGRVMVTASAQEALVQRRDLQYELLRERRDSQAVVQNHRQRDDRRWRRHLAVQHTGYDLLDSCAVAGKKALDTTEIARLAEDVRAL